MDGSGRELNSAWVKISAWKRILSHCLGLLYFGSRISTTSPAAMASSASEDQDMLWKVEGRKWRVIGSGVGILR